MKILVLSDSHSALRFMRACIEKVKPHTVIHLGDYYDDGAAMADEYPEISFVQVPGNCDRYRCPPFCPEVLIQSACGLPLYMTHGHKHMVKSGVYRLLLDARKAKVQAVLYGHTHIADCHQEEDGLWVMNPGSCGYGGGTAGIIETAGGKVQKMYLINQTDLEEMV